jgi:hypothetical protein
MDQQPYKSSPLHCMIVQPRIFHNIKIIHIPEQSHIHINEYLVVVNHYLYNISGNSQFFWVDRKKLVVNCGKQKWVTENFQSPLWQLKAIAIIFIFNR